MERVQGEALSGAVPEGAGEAEAAVDSGLLSLVMIGRFHQLPADAGALAHARGSSGPFSRDDLIRAARSLGLRAKAHRPKPAKLAAMPLPALVGTAEGKFIALAQVNGDKVLVQDPAVGKPQVLALEEFRKLWTGELILLTRRHSLAENYRKFGIGWFAPAVWKYKRLFAEVLVLSFFLQLFALVTPLFFQVVVDKVLVHRGLTTLDVLMIALVVVTVFETLVGTMRTYVFAHTASRIDVTLGAKLFQHLLRLPMAYFGARRVGDSVARVRELETIREFLTSSALTLVIDLAFTFVFLAVMAWYSLPLTAIVLASIPLFVILSLVVTPILRRRVEEKFARHAENQAFLVESVTGVETLKALAVEPQMQRRWEEQLAGYVGSSFKAISLGNVASQGTQLIAKLTTAAVLYFGALQVIDGALTVGALVAFNMLAGRVTGPVLRLAQLWQDFCQARIALDRLGDILNTAPEPVASVGRAALPRIQGRVTLEHVRFRYRPDGPEVLRSLSLDVPPGQSIGIVGPSGSGKSTLTKLIQRLHVPESGRVMVDGVDLALVDPAWLRRQIGVVLQENVLFHRSIRENIALADPAMPMERVIEAARLAGAHDFICQLPEGYDTLVGERGASLSGGQRQRIAIARALVLNPRILIFDEATSALDLESESVIQDNMSRIAKGRTVIIIAHRLAAVRRCDRIVTVENGEVTEDGNHHGLLQRGGRYATLFRHQGAANEGPA